MPELNDAVAAAVARWQECRMPCSCKDGTVLEQSRHSTVRGDTLQLHATCGGSGYIQPLEVKALIEAVTVPCPCYPGFNYCHDSSCCCDGTGRVPRDWEEIGEGALKGRLIAVLESFDSGTNIYSPQRELVERVRHCFGNSPALAAVDEALEQMYTGKSNWLLAEVERLDAMLARYKRMADGWADAFGECKAKVQALVDYMDKLGLLDDHRFTFPDGDTWEATKQEGANA